MADTPTPSREHVLRGRIAAEHRRRDRNPDLIAELRREHAVVKIEDYVRSILATAPPLTADQRGRLAALVGGGADAAA